MVQKTIEIRSFGAINSPLTENQMQTVPRKRRPRGAAGEVFITSYSNIYLFDDLNKHNTNNGYTTEMQECDPIYQNTANEKLLLDKNNKKTSSRCKKKNKSDPIKGNQRYGIRKRHSFCTVRTKNTDFDTEVQQVSAFIGKIELEASFIYF